MQAYFGGFDVRAWRRWLAGLMMLGFISAQLISFAHACASGPDPYRASAEALGGVAAMPADCPMATGAAPSADTACDAHCVPRGARIASPPLALLLGRLLI
jgi:hypothetical protein